MLNLLGKMEDKLPEYLAEAGNAALLASLLPTATKYFNCRRGSTVESTAVAVWPVGNGEQFRKKGRRAADEGRSKRNCRNNIEKWARNLSILPKCDRRENKLSF